MMTFTQMLHILDEVDEEEYRSDSEHAEAMAQATTRALRRLLERLALSEQQQEAANAMRQG